MVVLGYDSTGPPVSMDDMVISRAPCGAAPHTPLVIGDLRSAPTKAPTSRRSSRRSGILRRHRCVRQDESRRLGAPSPTRASPWRGPADRGAASRHGAVGLTPQSVSALGIPHAGPQPCTRRSRSPTTRVAMQDAGCFASCSRPSPRLSPRYIMERMRIPGSHRLRRPPPTARCWSFPRLLGLHEATPRAS